MVRIAAVFAVGIVVALYFSDLLSSGEATVFLIVLALGYFPVRWFLRNQSALAVTAGILGLGVVLLAGYKNVELRNESLRQNALIRNTDSIRSYQLQLLSIPERRERSHRVTGRVVAIQSPAGWRVADGKVMVYLAGSVQQRLDYGDVLLVKGQPELVAGPQNPNEFDYRRFLALRNVFHQHVVSEGEWMLTKRSGNHGVMYWSCRTKAWTTETIERYVKSPREQAVVKALVVGATDGIDDGLRQAFVAGGAMHVLAVSGLHVGILYSILLFCMRPLDRGARGKWMIAGVSLGVLWSYAFVTGLSPSVLRAVTMFSFLALATPLRRSTAIYNTLAASAFLLLIYDPFLILSVGFQLSYAAVFGIVLLHRPLYNLWEPKNSWLDRLWQITCISLAAQLATAPLTLYYFHQFPVYFLVANVFVIPGAFLILVGGIGLLAISSVSGLATLFGLALEGVAYAMNALLFQIEQWPLSVIADIHLTLLQSVSLALITLGGFLLFKTRRFYWMVPVALMACLFSADSWRKAMRAERIGRFVVYRIPGQSAMEWVDGRQSHFLGDQIDGRKVSFHMAPHRLASGTRVIQGMSSGPMRPIGFFRLGGKHFFRINSRNALLPAAFKTDYLIVSHNAVDSLKGVIPFINFGQLILDSSNSLRYCDRLQREAQMLQKPCFVVLKEGAFTLNL